MATLPKDLLTSINSWNTITSSYWTVRNETVHLEEKNTNIARRIQNAWQGTQDLSLVFDTMHSTIVSIKRERILNTFSNSKVAAKWESALTQLKTLVTQRKDKYVKASGIISSVYRSVLTKCSHRGNVDSKAKKLLKEINTLLRNCKKPSEVAEPEMDKVVEKELKKKAREKTEPQTRLQTKFEVDSDFHSYSLPRDKDLRPIVINQIEKAKKSITIFIYSFTDEKMMKALESKAKSGVTVKVLCEKDTFIHAKRKLDSSIDIQILEPKGLMHLKIIVIDTHSVIFGSTNLTTGGMTKDNNIITCVKSNQLAKMILNKAKNYEDTRNTNGEFELSEGRKIDFIFLPDKTAAEKLIAHIKTAKKSLDIAMYTWTHEAIAKAVIEKHEAGVKVTAVIDGGQGGPNATGHKVTEMLQKAGIKVILPKANHFKLQHHKFVLIDKTKVIHGSANWTENAFKVNMDFWVALTDLTKSDRNNFESIWDDLVTAVKH